jgi:hypothetical protein
VLLQQPSRKTQSHAALYEDCFVKGCPKGAIHFSSSVSLFDPEARLFAPTHKSRTLSRAGAVKVGRRANAATHCHHR